MKDPIQKRIDARIKVKDAREDAKQRSITISWSINAAVASLQNAGINGQNPEAIELRARTMLNLFDKLFEERSQEQARRYEVEDEAKTAAELEAGDE